MRLATLFLRAEQVVSSNFNHGLQSSLGGWHDPDHARIWGRGHAQRAAKGFKNGLDLMVGIDAAQIVYVESHLRVIDQPLKELAGQVNIEICLLYTSDAADE